MPDGNVDKTVISIASLQRTVAVMALLFGLAAGEVWLFGHSQQLLPDTPGRVLTAVFAIAFLAFAGKLMAWERRRRLTDAEAVQRVLGAARSLGVEPPEDRAIFPIFYRGSKLPPNPPAP